ncbi:MULTISPECIES: MAB_1171c family putative transporter [unclassified Streptomyces]|uniref:MAB_1171c family putative transporter n=1 Tax=Streptomyces sp. NPDC127532 TaxID=3345399 RepID=UPI00363FB8DA
MLSGLIWAAAIAMTAVALWRLPALRHGDRLRRSLWFCTLAFSGTIWCRVPQVKHALDHSPVTDLSALGKYLTSMGAILAILNYITAIYARPISGVPPRHITVSRRVSRVANASALGALAAMVVLFFTVVDRSRPSVDFAADHAGQWGAGLFLTIVYTYLAAAASTCCYQWSRASRRADTRSLRIGLTLMAAAMVIYTVYPALRIFTVWFPTDASSVTMRTIADSVNLVVAGLWAAGASIPSTTAVAARWTSRCALRTLYPLWRDLMRAFPHLAFQPPGSAAREMIRLSPPLDVRLDRWTQEIGDAVEQLRHHAAEDLMPCAQAAAEYLPDPEPAAEAYWIRAALHSAGAGKRAPLPVRGLPSKPLSDARAEGFWLARVTRAYTAMAPEQVRQLLQKAGAPASGSPYPEGQARAA